MISKLDEEEVIKLYLKEKLNLREIADKLQSYTLKIRNILLNNNVQLRTKKEAGLLKINPDSLIGKRFGRLIVLKITGLDESSQRLCECKCTCGTKKEFVIHNLKSGHTKSCGCYKSEQTRNRTYKGNNYLTGANISSIWNSAIKRKLSLPLNKEILCKWVQFLGDEQKGLCKICGKKLRIRNSSKTMTGGSDGVSLDRIDSTKGYDNIKNLQLLCWKCNYMKGYDKQEEYIKHCKRVTYYQNKLQKDKKEIINV